jgi:ribosome biogenesis GTPase / thiamine phosphate phosphatase
VAKIALGVPVHLISALDCKGLPALEGYLSPGRTSTMIGSSGAGKSTLVNRLSGKALQAIASISSSYGLNHRPGCRDSAKMAESRHLL